MTKLFNDVHNLTTALKFGMTRDEALTYARWYQERERCADVQYQDAVHGKGVFTVNSMGIMERSATATEWKEITLHAYLIGPDEHQSAIVEVVHHIGILNSTARRTKVDESGIWYVQDMNDGEGEWEDTQYILVTERELKEGDYV